VRELAEFLVGTAPHQIERHWQTLRRVGFFRGGAVASSAAAAIDCALWDIAGRRRGAPVHQLIGGPVRDSLKAFAVIESADEVPEHLAMGFTAFTLQLGTIESSCDGTVALVDAVRSAIGRHSDLAVRCGGQLSIASALRLLPRLERHRLLALHEPVGAAPPQVLANIARHSRVPLSIGRHVYSRWDLKPVLAAGLAAAELDLAAAGGISETRRMADLAETHRVQVSLASGRGPVALAASLQVGFATANVVGQAWSAANSGWHADYVSHSHAQVEGGYYTRPVAPGLGISVDEAAVLRAAA
jgi:galactonate dehydratase